MSWTAIVGTVVKTLMEVVLKSDVENAVKTGVIIA